MGLPVFYGYTSSSSSSFKDTSACLESMNGEMDEDELEEWKTIFNLFDVDGDQSITGEVIY